MCGDEPERGFHLPCVIGMMHTVAHTDVRWPPNGPVHLLCRSSLAPKEPFHLAGGVGPAGSWGGLATLDDDVHPYTRGRVACLHPDSEIANRERIER